MLVIKSGALILMVLVLLFILPVWGWAMLLIFVLPGVAIIAALFPNQSLPLPEYVLFVVGASIATVILSGLALDKSFWGIEPSLWMGGLIVVSFGAALVAWLRGETGLGLATAWSSLTTGLQWHHILLMTLALLLVGTSVVMARIPAPPTGKEGYTQLAMQVCRRGESPTLQLTVSSYEFTPATYRLEIRLGEVLISKSSSLTLKPGQEQLLLFDLLEAHDDRAGLEAALYRTDSPTVDPTTVYRHVALRHANWQIRGANGVAYPNC